MKPLVSVIIVSYNTRKLTSKSISSVLASSGLKKDELEVIVVDNNSSDDSVSYIHTHFPTVQVIANKTNSGFGGGNNQGAKVASGKYLLLLNTDAFLAKDSLRVMVDKMEADDQLVSVGPQLLYEDGSLQLSGGYLPTPCRVFRWILGVDVLISKIPLMKDLVKMYHVRSSSWHTREQYPEWLMGACVLFRREEFLSAGGFDDKIFMYAEEVELYMRLKDNLGKKVLFTPDTQVVHVGGVSTKRASASRLTQELRGIEYIYQTHYPRLVWLIKLIIRFGISLRVAIFCLVPARHAIIKEYLGYFKHKGK